MYIPFLRPTGIVHLVDCSVNMTFTFAGKPKNSYDSLYCDAQFVRVVWS